MEQPTAYYRVLMSFHDLILKMKVFIMCNMCLIIFEEKTELQDQYPLSLNPVQKADDPIQDRKTEVLGH